MQVDCRGFTLFPDWPDFQNKRTFFRTHILYVGPVMSHGDWVRRVIFRLRTVTEKFEEPVYTLYTYKYAHILLVFFYRDCLRVYYFGGAKNSYARSAKGLKKFFWNVWMAWDNMYYYITSRVVKVYINRFFTWQYTGNATRKVSLGHTAMFIAGLHTGERLLKKPIEFVSKKKIIRM